MLKRTGFEFEKPVTLENGEILSQDSNLSDRYWILSFLIAQTPAGILGLHYLYIKRKIMFFVHLALLVLALIVAFKNMEGDNQDSMVSTILIFAWIISFISSCCIYDDGQHCKLRSVRHFIEWIVNKISGASK